MSWKDWKNWLRCCAFVLCAAWFMFLVMHVLYGVAYLIYLFATGRVVT